MRTIVAGGPLGVLAFMLLVATAAAAGDAAKHECRQGCQEALRSCKDACRPERDSGDLEASQLYVDCDGDCHSTYGACVASCAPD